MDTKIGSPTFHTTDQKLFIKATTFTPVSRLLLVMTSTILLTSERWNNVSVSMKVNVSLFVVFVFVI